MGDLLQALDAPLTGIVDFPIGTLNLEKDFPAFRQLRSLQRFYGVLHGFLLLKLCIKGEIYERRSIGSRRYSLRT